MSEYKALVATIIASIDEQIRGLQTQKATLLGLSTSGSSSSSNGDEVSNVSRAKGKGKGKVPVDGKKKRVKKDPNEPKSPGSGYNLFVKDFTLKYKAANSNNASIDAFKAASEEWKKLSVSKKEEYISKSKIMLTDYKKQKEIYDQSKGIITSPEVATRVSFSQESLSDNLNNYDNTESAKKKDKKKKRSNSESDGDDSHHEKKKKKKKDKSKDRESLSTNAVDTDDE